MGAIFIFLRRPTITGTPDHPLFVFLPPRAFGAQWEARGQEEPHLAGGKDDSRAGSLSTSLPNALSPAPLTEFLINDEMWYK